MTLVEKLNRIEEIACYCDLMIGYQCSIHKEFFTLRKDIKDVYMKGAEEFARRLGEEEELETYIYRILAEMRGEKYVQ
ncbi:MAG: hypothetical protein AABY07_00910 [Nanoarchaeota archaeon]